MAAGRGARGHAVGGVQRCAPAARPAVDLRARPRRSVAACAPKHSTRSALRQPYPPTAWPPRPPTSLPPTTCSPRRRWRRSSRATRRARSSCWRALRPTSVEGRLCEALAYSGAAALGAADPAIGTAKAATRAASRWRQATTASIVVASWAQAAAAHARGDLHQSVWADLQETSHVPHLAVRVFDGHLCITQRFLYGSRPYADVDCLRRLAGHRGAAPRRSARAMPSAPPCAARRNGSPATWTRRASDLREGARLHRAIGGRRSARRCRCSASPNSRCTRAGATRRARCSTKRWTWPGRPTSASTCSTASTARASRCGRRSGRPRCTCAGRRRVGARPVGDVSRLPHHLRGAGRHRGSACRRGRARRASTRRSAPIWRTSSCACRRGTPPTTRCAGTSPPRAVRRRRKPGPTSRRPSRAFARPAIRSTPRVARGSPFRLPIGSCAKSTATKPAYRTLTTAAVGPWYATLVKGQLYDAGEFLQVQEYLRPALVGRYRAAARRQAWPHGQPDLGPAVEPAA